jgi:hypothetical protein
MFAILVYDFLWETLLAFAAGKPPRHIFFLSTMFPFNTTTTRLALRLGAEWLLPLPLILILAVVSISSLYMAQALHHKE